MAKDKTIFQKLTDVMIGTSSASQPKKVVSSYTMRSPNDVMYSFDSKEERDLKLKQLKQQRLLAYQWKKIGYDTSMEQMAGTPQVRIMYRDADLMDCWPEIGSALDIYSEEATVLNKKNKMLNISSKSNRIVSVLEDLFENRLDIHIMLPMIARSLCKYGNEFMFLNIDGNDGVKGWRELPVHEMRRVENGMFNLYAGYGSASTNLKPDETKFIWEGHNESTPFKMWQVAHIRLIKDSLLLPYGVKKIINATRHSRMI